MLLLKTENTSLKRHPGFEGYNINNGIEMTDRSTALVPYLKGTKEQFILISTGKRYIFLNPFNTEH